MPVLEEAWRILRPGGRVLSISGLSLPVGDDMALIFEALSDTLGPGRREQAIAVSSVGGDVGFELVHEGLAITAGDVSPNALADKMEERLFAHLWDLSDEKWGRTWSQQSPNCGLCPIRITLAACSTIRLWSLRSVDTRKEAGLSHHPKCRTATGAGEEERTLSVSGGHLARHAIFRR